MKNAATATIDDRDAEHVPGPAPPFGAARPSRRCRADEHRAGEAEAVPDHVVERRHAGAHADRVVVGDQRVVHRDRVGLGDAGGEPGPEQHERVDRRARTGTRRTPKKRLETPTIGTRFTRSASQPIGTAPSTKNAADAVPMNTIAPSLMPNVRRISGASTLIAAPSSSSSELSAVRTTNIEPAALADALAQRDRLGVDAGQQVVGEDDLLACLGLRLLARRLLVQHGGCERGGGLRRVRQPARQVDGTS